MTLRLAATGVAAAVAVAVLLAGCSATSRPQAASSGPTPITSTPSSPPVTVTPSTSSPVTSTAPPAPVTSSGTPSSTAPTNAPVTGSQTPVPPQSTCRKLTVRVLIGSGAPGYEFAALQFVNDGSSPCTLAGVPTVTLLRKGAQTGRVSRPSSRRAPFTQYRLAPGATAESRLKDFSGCNAPLSDTVRVIAPGSGITATRPGVLRACRLVVYPLGAPE